MSTQTDLQSIDEADLVAIQAQVGIDREYVSSMLVALGVDMTHPLSASFVLGAFDVLACVEVAQHLPAAADFESALRCFHTLRHVQPAAVRQVQIKVLEVACCSGMTIDQDRLATIRRRLDHEAEVSEV